MRSILLVHIIYRVMEFVGLQELCQALISKFAQMLLRSRASMQRQMHPSFWASTQRRSRGAAVSSIQYQHM